MRAEQGNIRRGVWLKFDYRNLRLLPRWGGYYAVYVRQQLVYIGSSVNIRWRLSNYLNEPARRNTPWRTAYGTDGRVPLGVTKTPWGYTPHEDISIKVRFTRRRGEWLMHEWRLITRLRPRFNRAGKAA